MNDTVAICIPTYNQAQYLRRAVESALQQKGNNVEIWVGDDASTDETGELMKALRREHPAIKYLRADENRGIAENSSWILSQPQSSLLVRLDSDDQLSPSYVETVLAWMSKFPKAGYAHTAVLNVDREGRALGVRRLVRPTGYEDAETALRAAAKGYRTTANILTFRREALRRLDFYRGRPEFVEDYDLSVRMADAGYGNIYVDEPLALYRVWADSENRRAKRKFLQLSGYIRIFEESLHPAFGRRGWDTSALDRGRRRFSAMNVAYCHQAMFTRDEQQTLCELLYRLGDSPALRFRVLMVRFGFGPVMQAGQSVSGAIKNYLKSLLSFCRRHLMLRLRNP